MLGLSDKIIQKIVEVLDFSKIAENLIPVITQDYVTNEILIFAFANEEAVKKSLKTGYMHYYSRSRKRLWKKGEESGHFQLIKEVITDCDKDTLLFKVEQIGAACHKGYFTCFHNELDDGKFVIRGEKLFEPDEVYKRNSK